MKESDDVAEFAYKKLKEQLQKPPPSAASLLRDLREKISSYLAHQEKMRYDSDKMFIDGRISMTYELQAWLDSWAAEHGIEKEGK